MQENVKQVIVKMTARRAFRTEPIWQYDTGHELVFEGFDGLPATFQVHFSLSPMGQSITQVGQNGVCTLPDMYTRTAAPIYAWLYIAETDTGLTKHSIEIPVQRRAKITDQQPTPVEQSAIDQAIAALNAGAAAAEEAQEAAEAAQASAESYAESAGQSAITATNAATSAAASAGNAAASATSAGTSATDANASRQAADLSATNAGVSERNAAASASAAAGSATSAATSAGQASASATAASGSASTASTKAGEAAQSATAAAGSAASASEDAGTASTAATVAEGSATAAAGSATAAAGSATSAGQSATAAAGSASDAAATKAYMDEHYGEISEDVSELKSAFDSLDDEVHDPVTGLDNKAPVIITTASGDIASFDDGANGMPIKGMTVQLEPVQDLHGQDAPYPPGGGKNLFNKDTYTYGYYLSQNTGNLNPSTSSAKWDTSDFIPVKENTAYISSPWNVASNAEWCFYDSNKQFISGVSSKTRTQTTPAGTAYMRVDFPDSALNEFQVEEGSTATTYAPYSNICPISGHTGANVTRTGKNLFPEKFVKGLVYNPAIGAVMNLTDDTDVVKNGNVFSKDVASWSGMGMISGYLPSGSYTISAYLESSNMRSSVFTLGSGLDVIRKLGNQGSGTARTVSTTATLTGDEHYFAIVNASSVYGTVSITSPQIELGSTATAYEPYSGQTYPITFPSEAGTVYGGSLTVNEDGTGVLSVDRGSVNLGDLSWSISSDNVSFISGSVPSGIRIPGSQSTVPTMVCTTYAACANSSLVNGGISIAPSGKLKVRDDAYNLDASAFKTGVADVLLVYQLATPLTYSLTATQITTLLGSNRIWADTGAVNVDYCADTKLYIEQLTKLTEDDMKANTAITSGKFFMIGNRLFLATAAIASGATIIPGTNCTELSLADALNNINA